MDCVVDAGLGPHSNPFFSLCLCASVLKNERQGSTSNVSDRVIHDAAESWSHQ